MRKWLIAAILVTTGMTCGGDRLSAAAPAPTAALPPRDDAIRIIPQNQGADQDDPDLAAWSPDEAVILTAWSHGNDQVLLRDPDNGHVINRLTLPPAPDGDDVTVNTLQFGPTRDTASATALASNYEPQPRCRSITYAIDLVAMTISQTWQNRPSADCGSGDAPADAPTHVLATAPHSGRELVVRTAGRRQGLLVADRTGKFLNSLARSADTMVALKLRFAALGPDRRTLVLIVDRNDGVEPVARRNEDLTGPDDLNATFGIQHSTFAVFDTVLQRFGHGLTVDAKYNRAAWIDAKTVLVTRASSPDEREQAALSGLERDRSLYFTPPAQVFDLDTGRITATIRMRCYMTPVAHGAFIAAGLASCLWAEGGNARGLQRYEPGKGWQGFAPGIEGDSGFVDAITVSPDGGRAAVVVHSEVDGTDTCGIMLIDTQSGQTLARFSPQPGVTANDVQFAPGGRNLVLLLDGKYLVWDPSGSSPPTPVATGPAFAGWPGLTASDGTTLVNGAQSQNRLALFSLADHRRLPDLHFDDVVAAGFVPGKPEFWAASAGQGLRLWDTRTWAPIQTVMLFGGHHSLAITPDGRYDTDLGPDTSAFRWLVRDEPFRSLGPQTFMRTYYTPRLLERLDQCIPVAIGCAAVFPRLPAPLDVNRALPTVTIDAVRAGARPATAQIDVTATEGSDDQAPNGQTRSRLYNLRLFRNDSLVAEYPAARTEDADQSMAEWQAANAIPAGPDGRAHHRFFVTLPGGAGQTRVRFSAYAFNSDRIKSDTATRAFDAPRTPPRPHRTFVLAIGIDAYAEPRLTLHYAASDATLLARRLARLPHQQVHTLILSDAMATKAGILAALDLLGGGDRKADLAALGLRASPFAAATPDDTVIITFSGHGTADMRGNFFLLPADAQWADKAQFAKKATLLSSAELADALKRIDAGEIALVIDACHSGASVDTAWFKPGPMGDPGLGQLAFDKGIRILAAAGPADVAREDSTIGHGLLTYVLTTGLTGEAVRPKRFAPADLDHDGRVMLDEWLRYAVKALPALSQREQQGPAGQRIGRFIVVRDSQAVPPRPQVPALFDFTQRASTESLREAGQ